MEAKCFLPLAHFVEKGNRNIHGRVKMSKPKLASILEELKNTPRDTFVTKSMWHSNLSSKIQSLEALTFSCTRTKNFELKKSLSPSLLFFAFRNYTKKSFLITAPIFPN